MHKFVIPNPMDESYESLLTLDEVTQIWASYMLFG